MCFDCGSRRGPLVQRGEERYTSGGPVVVCAGGCRPPSLAARTYDAQTVENIVQAAGQQLRAEHTAELAEAQQDYEARAWFHDRQRAVGQLCEDRHPDDMVKVGDVLTALDNRAPTTLPLTLTWDGSVTAPAGDGPGEFTLVGCTTARGGRAVLALDDDQRQALASLLGLEVRDIDAKCATPGCGTEHDLDASDLFGWSRLEVASLGDGPRWYCSDMCVFDALARAGHDLREADRQDEMGGAL